MAMGPVLHVGYVALLPHHARSRAFQFLSRVVKLLRPYTSLISSQR